MENFFLNKLRSLRSFKQNATRVSRLIKDQRRTPPGTDSRLDRICAQA